MSGLTSDVERFKMMFMTYMYLVVLTCIKQSMPCDADHKITVGHQSISEPNGGWHGQVVSQKCGRTY